MPKPSNSSRDAMKASTSGSKVRAHQFKLLSNNFDCPRCGGKQCVSVKVEAAKRSGTVRCRAPECAAEAAFETHFLPKLEKPIDVFYRFFEHAKAEQRTQDIVARSLQNNPAGAAAVERKGASMMGEAATSNAGMRLPPGAAAATAAASTVLASPLVPHMEARSGADELFDDDDDDSGSTNSTDSELADLYGGAD